MSAHSSVADVRLSPDALHLEATFSPSAALLKGAELVDLLVEQSERLNVRLVLSVRDIEARLQTYRSGSWITLLSGTTPSLPIDGRVELLIAMPVSSRHIMEIPDGPTPAPLRMHGTRQAVRAGTPLARLHPGTDGSPGSDLFGRAIEVRPARQTRLPQGHNTLPSADGLTLLAKVDGEVRLHNLMIEVVPMHVHDGDVTADNGPITAQEGVFVTGSVKHGRVDAWGPIFVQGNVAGGWIESRGASVDVAGQVTGSDGQACVIRASANVSSGTIIHADIRAGKHIVLLADARHCTLAADGNIYVQSVEKNLLDARLQLGGGIVPLAPLPPELISMTTDREHFRVALTIDAAVALHGTEPLLFTGCTILDLSTNGARCRLNAGEPRPGTIVQLKFDLPDGDGQVLSIARVARWISPGVVGLALLQMTRRDQHRIKAYCVHLLLERRHGKLATKADRH